MMKKLLLLIAMIMPAALWAGEWQLDASASTINFVSVKKGSVGEVHHFGVLNGSLNGNRAVVTIDLTSVESGIGIRNERMRNMLFEVSRFATASVSADLAGIDHAALKCGETRNHTLPLKLDLHGISRELAAEVTVAALADGGLLVSSRKPVIVKAADFELDGGIEALREIAKLPAIASSVPVTFQLIFSR